MTKIIFLYYLLIISLSHATRNIYTENLREATASDTYILRGDPISETYEPRYEMPLYDVFRSQSLFRLVSLTMVFVMYQSIVRQTTCQWMMWNVHSFIAKQY